MKIVCRYPRRKYHMLLPSIEICSRCHVDKIWHSILKREKPKMRSFSASSRASSGALSPAGGRHGGFTALVLRADIYCANTPYRNTMQYLPGLEKYRLRRPHNTSSCEIGQCGQRFYRQSSQQYRKELS